MVYRLNFEMRKYIFILFKRLLCQQLIEEEDHITRFGRFFTGEFVLFLSASLNATLENNVTNLVTELKELTLHSEKRVVVGFKIPHCRI